MIPGWDPGNPLKTGSVVGSFSLKKPPIRLAGLGVFYKSVLSALCGGRCFIVIDVNGFVEVG